MRVLSILLLLIGACIAPPLLFAGPAHRAVLPVVQPSARGLPGDMHLSIPDAPADEAAQRRRIREQADARTQVQGLVDLVEDHGRRHRVLPESLAVFGDLPLDPWGRPFRYRVQDGVRFEIRSAGPDEVFDTRDDAGLFRNGVLPREDVRPLDLRDGEVGGRRVGPARDGD